MTVVYRNNPRLFSQTARLVRKGWSNTRIMDELLLPYDYVAEVREVLDTHRKAERIIEETPRDAKSVTSARRRELVTEAYS